MLQRMASLFFAAWARMAPILRALSAAVLLTLSLTMAAQAVEPDEILADVRLEERARGLSSELRCLVCQNQSIDDSSAPLARDLRLLVRDRLKAGDSDAQVRQFLVARYGDFVLLKPPFNAGTVLLWLAPLLILLAGLALVARHVRRPAVVVGGTAGSHRLDADEEARLAELLRKTET